MDRLEQLQTDVAALLQAVPAFRYAPIIIARPRSTFVGLTSVSLTQGSTTLTCASTSALSLGTLPIPIAGPGIPAGATIAATPSLTTLTLSAAAAATLSHSTATATLVVTAPMLQQKLQTALTGQTPQNGKAGVGLVVLMPKEVPIDNDSRAAELPVRQIIAIYVYENTLINMSSLGTMISCETLANEVVRNLQNYPLSGGQFLTLSRDGKRPVDSPNMVTYAISFERYTTRRLPARVAKPIVTGPADSLVISCATPGAQLWFTIDGSFPAPNPGASGPNTSTSYELTADGGVILTTDTGQDILTGALALPAGVLLRVAAYDPSGTLAPSIVTQVQL